MFANAGAAGHHRDVDQIQIPEAAQLGIPLNGNIEGRSQLDGPGHPGRCGRFICGVNRIGDIVGPLDLRTEEIKESIRLAVDAAGQLDLLDHLIGCMVQLLFCRDDAEQVDDKGQQDDGDEDEHHRGEIVGLAPFALQCPADFLQESMNVNHHLYLQMKNSRPDRNGCITKF